MHIPVRPRLIYVSHRRCYTYCLELELVENWLAVGTVMATAKRTCTNTCPASYRALIMLMQLPVPSRHELSRMSEARSARIPLIFAFDIFCE